MIKAEISHLRNPTVGEKKAFRAIASKTPDNWICYTKCKIMNGNEPDFFLIGPDLGIIVLEEKGITIEMIQEANHESWNIIRNSLEAKENNPERQARGYILQAVDLVKKVAKLRNDNGQLKFPYGHGIILSNITRQQFNETSHFSEPLSNSFNDKLVICKDEIPNINEQSENFANTIKKMVDYFKFSPLTDDEIQSIKYSIFPGSRVRSLGDWKNDKNAELFSLEVEQEQLAMGIGKNDKIPHRLVRGVSTVARE